MRKIWLIFLMAAAVSQAFGQEKGMASYYGGRFHGRKTASGEVFDKNAMTCAHKTLPFGTMLKVTHVKSGKSVVVKVNDRGPYAKGRILDLSEGAAKVLGFDGVGLVSYEIIKPEPTKENKGEKTEYNFLECRDSICALWLPEARHGLICLGNYHIWKK